MSWLWKSSDVENVRARQRIEELHQFYQQKLATLTSQVEAQAQDHAEDMKAKNDVLKELVNQKQESEASLALMQEKLLSLSAKFSNANLQLRHREAEVLKNARAVVSREFASPHSAGSDGADLVEVTSNVNTKEIRHCDAAATTMISNTNEIFISSSSHDQSIMVAEPSNISIKSSKSPHKKALAESQARMRQIAEVRHQRALEALETRYKGLLEDQKRRHHQTVIDAATTHDEALADMKKLHEKEINALRNAHEEDLRHLHRRLAQGRGIPLKAMSVMVNHGCETRQEKVPKKLQTNVSVSCHTGDKNNQEYKTRRQSNVSCTSDSTSSIISNSISTNIGQENNTIDIACSAQQLMETIQDGRDGYVQKAISRHIVLSLVKSTSRAYTLQVMDLAAKVLDFSPFERLDAGLGNDSSATKDAGILSTIFGFAGGNHPKSSVGNSDPHTTIVTIAPVKALLLEYVNETDQGELHVILNELARLLSFTSDERQSCNLLKSSQRLTTQTHLKNDVPVVSDNNSQNQDTDAHHSSHNLNDWWFGSSVMSDKKDIKNMKSCSDSTIVSSTKHLDTLEKQWLAFLRFQRWGSCGKINFNLAWELAYLRRQSISIGGKAVQDTLSYEQQLLSTIQRHKESLVAEQFNARSKTWMATAQQLGLLKPLRGMGEHANTIQAREVARLLCTLPGLDKRIIGEWLSEPTDRFPFNDLVLRAFTHSFPFTKAGYQGKFCDALRQFLYSFRLPGEAQKIDRLMEAFARELYNAITTATPPQQHHSIFKSADTVYVLAFSTIMLNTDLHSPMMDDNKRMSLEGFIENNSGINDGEDLPSDFLIDLYNDIKSNEIKKDFEFFT